MKMYAQAYLELMRQRRPEESRAMGEEALQAQALEVEHDYGGRAMELAMSMRQQRQNRMKRVPSHEENARMISEARMNARSMVLEELPAAIEWEPEASAAAEKADRFL